MPKVQQEQSQSENEPVVRSKGARVSETTLPKERFGAGVEAVLLAVDRPLSPAKIAQALGLTDPTLIKPLIEELNETYEQTGRSFRIEQVAGGYRVLTLAEFAPAVAMIRGLRDSARLSRAAIETLAIIAYKQPITRVQVEAVRGVSCGEVIRTLLDRRMVAIVGRAEELGRPMLYGTSKLFLETFGLASVADLPKVTDLFPGTDPDATAQASASEDAPETGADDPA